MRRLAVPRVRMTLPSISPCRNEASESRDLSAPWNRTRARYQQVRGALVEADGELLALEIERVRLAPAVPRLGERGAEQAGVADAGARVQPVVGGVEGEDVGARVGARDEIARLEAPLDGRRRDVDL